MGHRGDSRDANVGTNPMSQKRDMGHPDSLYLWKTAAWDESHGGTQVCLRLDNSLAGASGASAVDGLMPRGDFVAAFFRVGLGIEATRFGPLAF